MKNPKLGHVMRVLAASLGCLLLLYFSSMGHVRALQMEGNADGDGTEGAMPAKAPPEMINASGDAVYSIPLTAPPGIHGMTPNLSLDYASSSGNGYLGVGWSLSLGYPLTIERSTRNGVPTYRTDQDEFILGNQRLIRDGNRFHPRLETFWRIEILSESCHFCGPNDPPQPTAWRVTQKDGTALLYTYQPWSRHAPQKIFRWYLDSITDVYGNRITLHYETRQDDQYGILHPYLASIRYAYPEPNAGGQPLNEIQLCTSDIEGSCWLSDAVRPDPMISHIHGLPDVIGNRYERIVVKHAGETVRTYDLDYEQSATTGRSRLISVQEIGLDGDSMPPHRFLYENGEFAWSDRSGDYPGDAFPPDFTASWFGSKGGIRSMDMGVRLADLNGDALVDVIISNNYEPGRVKLVKINNGDGTFDSYQEGDESWQIPFYFNQVLDARLMDRGVRVVDVNGDGMADLIQSVLWMGALSQRICTNNGSGWDCESGEGRLPDVPFVMIHRPPGFSANSYDMGMRIADLNGDGLPDFIRSQRIGDHELLTGVWLNTGGGRWEQVRDGRWEPPYSFTKPAVVDSASMAGPYLILHLDAGVRFGDVNGDGLDDMVVSFKDDTYNKEDTRDLCINTGGRFECGYAHRLPYFVHRTSHSVTRAENGSPYYVQIDVNEDFGSVVTDINGDGMSDIVYAFVSGGNYQSGAYLSLGDGRWENRDIPLNVAFTGTITDSRDRLSYRFDWGVRFGDLNGDGLADLIEGRYWFGGHQDSVRLRNGSKPDLLGRIILPEGGRISISYSPSTWMRAESDTLSADEQEEGLRQAPFAKWVVEAVERRDPLTGNVVLRKYLHEGACFDFQEREFRGFAYIKSYLVGSGGSEGPFIERWYGQSDALQNLLLRERSGEGPFFRETTNTYDPVESPRGVYFQKLARSDTRVTSEEGLQEKSYAKRYLEYDGYGNPIHWIDSGDLDTPEDDVDYRARYLATDVEGGAYIVDRLQYHTAQNPDGEILALDKNVYSDDLRFLLERKSARDYPIELSETLEGDANLITTRYAYYEWGDIKQSIDPRGTVTEYIYGSVDGCDNGRIFPCKTILAKGTRSEQSALSGYDLRYGELKWTVKADGQRTEYGRDGLGRLKTVTKPLLGDQPLEYYFYEFAGDRLSQEQPNVTGSVILPDELHIEVTEHFQDGFGRRIQTRKDHDIRGFYSGLILRDRFDQPAKIYLPFDSDALGFLGEAQLPEGLQFTKKSYKAGRIDVVLHPSIPEGTASTRYWYGAGYTVVFDPEDILTAMFFDSRGETIRTVRDYHNLDLSTHFRRDGLGRLIQIIDPRRLETDFGYDPRGNLVGKNTPDWSLSPRDGNGYPDIPYQVRYVYDDAGNRVLEQWGNDLRIKRVYDELGREVALCVSNDGGDPRCSEGTRDLRRRFYYDTDDRGRQRPFGKGKLLVALSYDGSGKRVSRIDFFYNEQGLVQRILAENQGLIKEMRFSYNRAGKLTSLVDPEGRVIRYEHDDLGRLDRFLGAPAVSVNGTPVIRDVDYDPRGRVSGVALGNGTTTTYTHDDRDFLRSLAHVPDDGADEIYSATYSYDLAGNLKRMVVGKGSAQYAYDALYRLVNVYDSGIYGRDFTYAYDPNGNLVKKIGVGDFSFQIEPDSNRIEAMEVDSSGRRLCPAYDRRGNMVEDGISGWHHSYDFANKIARSVLSKDGQTEVLSFAYDAFGRKIRRRLRLQTGGSPMKSTKTIFKLSSLLPLPSPAWGAEARGISGEPASRDKRYYYDTEGNRLYEVEGQQTTLYIFALGRRIAKINRNGGIVYFHQDHLGSTVALTDSDQKIPPEDHPPEHDPVRADPLRITSPSRLPAWMISRYGEIQFQASGGLPPYRWRLSGQLPASLSFENGRLFGAAENGQAGTYSIRVTVKDLLGNETSEGYLLRILEPLRFVTDWLDDVYCPEGDDGVGSSEYYKGEIIVTGGLPPYFWTIMMHPSLALRYKAEGSRLRIWGEVDCEPGGEEYPISVHVEDSQSPPDVVEKIYDLYIGS